MNGARLAVYISYDESTNGSFDFAVQTSIERGCVTWFSSFPFNPRALEFPTGIIVRLKGQERYFRGLLLAIVSGASLPNNFEEGERNHRPDAWFGSNVGTPASVLYMSHLHEVPQPQEVQGRHPPQKATYVDMLPARANAWAILLE